ncbi:2TM domain-containing protein [Soonwooa buanensis]|uniref:2TM domain-containing protein n=1 Tax=Soonwooa buanensis TaxID=619805 RepID=A0A1T5FTS5_9FLAO|nr:MULTISPECIES: 2TM domain-containing protein [Soonwooa]SKB99578.1 2TM domain-containing protein [Soonwooa buanensis]
MENIKEKVAFEIASERVKAIKKFYTSLAIFIVVSMAIVFWHFQKTGNFEVNLGRSFIIIVWAIILAVRAIKLFLLNSDWEKDMLNKELKKDQNNGYQR